MNASHASGQAPPPVNPGNTLQRVLIIRFGPLAGFIQSLGAARILRDVHRAAHITLLTTPEFADFARACPYFNIVQDDGAVEDARQRSAMVKRIRDTGFDMVYDLQNDPVTAPFFKEFRARFWSGVAPGASHVHANPARPDLHPVDQFADQLLYAGIGSNGLRDPQPWSEDQAPLPDLSWIPTALRNPPHLDPAYFTIYGPFALIIPGHAGDAKAPRAWAARHYAEICNRLFQQGVRPVLIGDKDDTALGRDIIAAAPDALNLMTRTDLFQLSALSRNAQLTIGGATGALQVAAANGQPVICLIAQAWDEAMAARMGTVWHPATQLSRSVPRGGIVVAQTAPDLDQISPDDIWQAIKFLDVLESGAAG